MADSFVNLPEIQIPVATKKLKPGSSQATISENIAREIRAGKPRDQAAAIAYSEARRTGKGKKKR